MGGKKAGTGPAQGPAAPDSGAGETCGTRDTRKTRVRELTASPEYAEIRQFLRDQAAEHGKTGAYYADQIRDYMDLWIKKRLLSEDIDKRGIQLTVKNGSQKFVKPNECLGAMLQVGQAMDRILVDLGIKGGRDGGGDPLGFGW